MNLPDFKRLIRPIANKIFLLLGRAVLKAIDNSPNTQNIQVIALADETISEIERFQEYGFETYPFAEAEVFVGFLNGNRDHGIALVIHDSRYRPTNLSEGEVTLYTDEDATTEFRLWLKRNRIAYLRADKLQAILDTEAYINSSQVMLGGDTWATLKAIMTEEMIAVFNNHVHSQGNDAGGDAQVNTDPPTTTLSVGTHATTKVKGI